MPSYFSAELLAGRGLPRAISTADLSIALVAAMVPDGLDVALVRREHHVDRFRRRRRLCRHHRQGQPVAPDEEHRRRIPRARQDRADRRALRVAQPGVGAAALRYSGARRDRGDRAADLRRSDQRRLEGRVRRHAPRPAHLADAALGPLPERSRHHGVGADFARLPVRMRILRRHPVSRPQAAPQAAGASGRGARSALRPRLPLRVSGRR